jgi:ABC-2 type transport system permease protein
MQRFDWIGSILKVNWANMTSNKTAFWSMLLLMGVQNIIYFCLWAIVFSRISSLRGWGLSEVAFLYGSGAIGYGVLFSIFGGLNQISGTIQSGMMDIYLARPRPVLVSVLMHRMRADSLGDIVAGAVMILVFVRPPLSSIPLLIILSLTAGMVYASFRLIMHTLAFWNVGGETSENGFIAFLIASTNPQNGFSAWGKLILLTIFPAGYIALIPVHILKNFSWPLLGLQLLGSITVLLFSLFLFHAGLKRYTSGNKFLELR